MRRLVPILLFLSTSALAQPQRFVYSLPADADVAVQKDMVYKTAANSSLHFDLYRPAKHSNGAPLPVVVFMQGVGGGDVRKWEQYTGWGKLVTTIGMAGVVYDSHQGAVTEDATDLLAYLRQHSAELHLDAATIILWACSANARAGLPLAMDPRQTSIKAAVIYYGVVEDATDLRMDLPVLVIRAGLDGAGINRALDRLVTRASSLNVPLSFINVPGAHHAFDVRDDNETSRSAIARTLDFMKTQIAPAMQRAVGDSITEASAVSAAYREDWPMALKSYDALLKIRPNDSELHRVFGNALFASGEYQRALTEYDRALALGNPNVGWVSYAAASAQMKLGNTDAALDWIDKLKDIFPMRRQLRTDPLFAPLKENPRFKAIAEMP